MHPALENLCGPEVWRVLDKCHNARNLGEYEGMLDVDDRLVTDLMLEVLPISSTFTYRWRTNGRCSIIQPARMRARWIRSSKIKSM
jgi:hypothetical protein